MAKRSRRDVGRRTHNRVGGLHRRWLVAAGVCFGLLLLALLVGEGDQLQDILRWRVGILLFDSRIVFLRNMAAGNIERVSSHIVFLCEFCAWLTFMKRA
jgi:hypothetical protein